METEDLKLASEIIRSISQVLLVVVPALLTGIFVYLSGKRSERIEIKKLKGQHEFEARSKIYEFLREQKQKLLDSHGSLSASLGGVLTQYITLLGQNYEVKGKLGGDENEFYQEYKKLMDPMVFTLFEVVNNQQRDLESMVKGTIRLFKNHKDNLKDSISELEAIEFPSHLTRDNFEYQSIKERVFRLQEINRLLSHHNDIYIQDEMEKLLETYINEKTSQNG
jgi:hypothetical protein